MGREAELHLIPVTFNQHLSSVGSDLEASGKLGGQGAKQQTGWDGSGQSGQDGLCRSIAASQGAGQKGAGGEQGQQAGQVGTEVGPQAICNRRDGRKSARQLQCSALCCSLGNILLLQWPP